MGAPDGWNPDAPLIELPPAKGAEHQWQVGGYRFELGLTPRGWRWGVSARGQGVGGCRTPLGALFAHTRWAGLPLYRLPGYGPVYRFVQARLHRHGYCVLRRSGPIAVSWHCAWCGNRAAKPKGRVELGPDLGMRLSP